MKTKIMNSDTKKNTQITENMVFLENGTIDFWRSDLMACNLLPSRQSYTLSHYLKITFVLYNQFVFIYFSFLVVLSLFHFFAEAMSCP